MHNIKLSKKINDPEKLDLHPPITIVYTLVDPEITWSIDPLNKIESFYIEGKKKDDSPFEEEIPQDFRTSLKLTVKKDCRYTEWSYTIHWMVKGKPHKQDPKISINPPKFDIIAIVIAIVSSIFGFLSFKFLLNKLRK